MELPGNVLFHLKDYQKVSKKRHPYLNQVALIFNRDGYWTILDYGMDIEPLKN